MLLSLYLYISPVAGWFISNVITQLGLESAYQLRTEGRVWLELETDSDPGEHAALPAIPFRPRTGDQRPHPAGKVLLLHFFSQLGFLKDI